MSEPHSYAVIAAILGMAVVSYVMRSFGYWAIGRLALTPRLRRALESLPGCVVVATILPIAAQEGVVAILAIGAAALVMAVLRSDFAAVLIGVSVAALARAAGI